MILVLGGTSDSLEICDLINEHEDLPYTLSVTTSYGEELAKKHTKNVVLGKMSKVDMMKFMNQNKINKIIDATHPYAIEVSKNAIDCAKDLNIDYIRYERKSLIEDISYENKYIVGSIEEGCKIAREKGNNIFIGTGSKNLSQIIDYIPDRNLIVRVLPTTEVIASCENLGLNADNIIAMKGPFSKSINEAFYKHYNVDMVITKESGSAGGFLEKITACEKLNIPVVIVKREKLDYPQIINEIKQIEKILSL
ncbi:precorrin-6A reductase [Romboutsia sp.]|uniref:precorrin-6A reductase n=1 Tax=Romboutsia sp. TaxID=1965302 RepID=UPI003F2B247B